jgi:hypothetical protein
MMPTPDWNAVRYDPGSARGHVESHFLKLNDADGRCALWLKATILRRLGEPAVAEGWAIAFDRQTGHVAVKQVVPFESAVFSPHTLDIRFAEVRFEPGSTRGVLRAGGNRIEWSLAFEGQAAAFVPLPERLYGDHLGTSKLVTPHPDLRFTGSYRVGDRLVAVDGWRGMQGHNWGRRHARAYGWVHCNVWQDADALVLEGITAQVALGPVSSPPISALIVTHGGVRHAFTPPQSLWRARGRITPRGWEFRAASRSARVSGSFSADTDDFVGLHYENPDRAMTYCLNSKIARGQVRLEVDGRPAVVANTRAAALEIGTHDPDHGVKMLA